MAYTKDYYHILSLDAPGWRSTKQNNRNHPINSTADLRRAYKLALLAAHPDKKRAGRATSNEGTAYTVDDVKEAYTTLADPKTRADYDNWWLHHGGGGGGDTVRLRSSLLSGPRDSAHLHGQEETLSSDFVLGLEWLDLSEFEAVESRLARDGRGDGVGEGQGEGQGQEERMEWMRACRCGADKGFRILEEELEEAEARGEKDVLVGCEGCSLWVRVGFDVEEG